MVVLVKETRVTLEDSIEVTRIWREDFPTTHQWQEVTYEPLPALAPVSYKKLTLPLGTTREDAEFDVSGSIVVYMGSTGEFSIKFGAADNDALTQDDIPEKTPLSINFTKVYITNTAQEGAYAKFLVL